MDTSSSLAVSKISPPIVRSIVSTPGHHPEFSQAENDRLAELQSQLDAISKRTRAAVEEISQNNTASKTIKQFLTFLYEELLRFHYNFKQLYWCPGTSIVLTGLFIFMATFGHHEFSALAELLRSALFVLILLFMTNMNSRWSSFPRLVHTLCMCLIMTDLIIIGSELWIVLVHRPARLFWFDYALIGIAVLQLIVSVIVIFSIDGISYARGTISYTINTAIVKRWIVSPFRRNAGFLQRSADLKIKKRN
jgi:hypothetical protein